MKSYDLYLTCACGEVAVTSYDENGEHTTTTNDTISYDRYKELNEFYDSAAEEEELMSLRDYFYELSITE